MIQSVIHDPGISTTWVEVIFRVKWIVFVRWWCYMNKGWKFLKKLWCCVSGGNKVIWLYQLSWKCKLATVISYKADVSSVSSSSERMEELWVVCGFKWRKWSYAIGVVFVDTYRIKSANMKNEILLKSFAAFRAT